MFCPNCGKEPPEGAQVCPSCGHILSMPVIAPKAPTAPGAPSAPGVPGPIQAKAPVSGFAIASLVLGILGICTYGLTGIPGLILGIMAYREINRSQGRIGGQGIAIGGLATSAFSCFLLLVAIIGIIAAIAIPQFIRIKAEKKQTEAEQNLQSIYSAQMTYYADNSAYAPSFEDLDWLPSGTQNYAYFLSESDVIQPPGKYYDLPPEARAYVDEYGFKAVAVANVDNDPTLDVWAIDQDDNLINVVNDVIIQ